MNAKKAGLDRDMATYLDNKQKVKHELHEAERAYELISRK